MSEVGSIVVRRQLGRELRTWRELAQRTLDDVATAQIASVSKVQRIEHGRTSVRPGDVRELCRLYGVSDETTEALADLARATRDPDWWERPETAAPTWFALYLRLEAVASTLCTFQPALVHGLFQTRDYAHQVEQLTTPAPDCAQADRYVATRMARQQQIFERPDPLRIHLVLGEAALLTAAGADDVMAAQRVHLGRVAGREHVDVRILPFSAGLHPGIRGAFSVLEFSDPADPPVAYVETHEGARYPENPAQVARYRQRFGHLWALAVPLEEYPT
jgi:transcriptional regulator with XRE-family HTH domain